MANVFSKWRTKQLQTSPSIYGKLKDSAQSQIRGIPHPIPILPDPMLSHILSSDLCDKCTRQNDGDDFEQGKDDTDNGIDDEHRHDVVFELVRQKCDTTVDKYFISDLKL